MKRFLILTYFLTAGFLAYAQRADIFFNRADAFLKENVKSGKVNYAKIKEQPDELHQILELANTIDLSKLDNNVCKAFYINIYNLLVISGIVKNYPLKSPLDIPGFFDEILYTVGDQKITLNEIENKLLRAKFPKEPRFHFVLVCAGMGCPPIINEAYLPSTVNTQMEYQTMKAINNPKFIRINGGDVNISQIFQWYKEDFEKAGGVLYFINEYREKKIAPKSKLGFYPYDWSLNAMD